MISISQWRSQAAREHLTDFDPAMAGSQQPEVLTWIALDGHGESDQAEHSHFLKEVLQIEELAVDDAMRARHPPKYEQLADGWQFLLMRGLDARSESINFGTIQLAFFWKNNLLITRNGHPSASIEAINRAIDSGDLRTPKTVADLLYAILRRMLDRYLPILLNLEERLEAVELELLRRPSDALLAELMEYGSKLKKLRRIGGYHEACFRNLIDNRGEQVGLNRSRLNDLHENSERLQSLASLLDEISKDLKDGYLSLSAHRLNHIMRVLTVVTVIFVPMTFVAGLYGMNFEYMPELKWHYGYFAALGVMTVIALGLLWVFKRRGWM